VGKRLWLRATDNAVTIYEDYRHVATYTRGRKPGSRFAVRGHLPPEAQAFADAREHVGFQVRAMERLGSLAQRREG